jgi:hypothetical protein
MVSTAKSSARYRWKDRILVNAAFLTLALVFIIALIGIIWRIHSSDQLHIGHP